MRGYYDSAHLNAHVADEKWSWLKYIVLVAVGLGKASQRSRGKRGKGRTSVMDWDCESDWLVTTIATPTHTINMIAYILLSFWGAISLAKPAVGVPQTLTALSISASSITKHPKMLSEVSVPLFTYRSTKVDMQAKYNESKQTNKSFFITPKLLVILLYFHEKTTPSNPHV